MSETTPPLEVFVPLYQADDNQWWRLSSGHHQNLFDEALERIESLEATLAQRDARIAELERQLGQETPRCDEGNQ